LANVRQLIVSVAVVGIALAAGVTAVAVLDPSFFLSSPSGEPTARASARPVSSGVAPSGSSSGPSAAPGDVAVLVGAGDIADCTRFEDELTANLVETIQGTVVTFGDHADPDGTPRQFEECYGPTWGRPAIKERTRPAPGDNDYDTPGAAGYFAYFGDAAGEPGAGYYAYDAGTWRVYVLNSNCGSIGGCGESSPQATWLMQDLAAEPRDCVVAIWHHPYFTSGPSEGGDSRTRSFWRILQAAGAELVLNGHDHHYERFVPQTAAGAADPNGMVQFIVGTGGSRPDDLRLDAPNSEARAVEVFGVLRLELAPGGYAFEFITVAGPQFTDRGTGDCH
jgi:hypothetical protein